MRVYCLLLIFGLLLALPVAAEPAAPIVMQPADVRLLIDVSGSMKRTDPQNLRKPAMELLVKLLPDGSRAGVWRFGESVTRLVSHGVVDREWRVSAARSANEINSSALFTNIGAALEQATYDLGQTDSRFRNNIILLTDGMVDIEANAEVNTRERERILNELLPRVQQAGYVVHTIALSNEADKGLMAQLALATDGVFATAEDADQLMSVFLRIFDQAVPMERLPLENNRFLVDAAVEEFTALIFRKPQAQKTELISPEGKKYTTDNAKAGVVWHKTASYDLITVVKPMGGEWQINAELDPDNRVTVVSNLKLQIAALKNNIEVSQPLELLFSFQEDDATVIDPRFLQLLDMDVIVTRGRDGKQWQIPLVNTVPPIDGIYNHPLELFRETGQYTVQLLIDGKTFKREFKHQVTVGSPFSISMERVLHKNQVAYRLSVSADDQRVDSSKTAIVAQIKNSSGASSLQNFALGKDGIWQLFVTPDVAARYSVGLQVSGLRRDGESVKEILPTQYFTYPDKDDPVPIDGWREEQVEPDIEKPTVIAEPVPEPVEPPLVENKEVNEPKDDVVETTPPSSSNKWIMYVSIGLAHVLVFGLGFLAYRLILGKKAKTETDELEETLNTDVQKIVEKKQPVAAQPQQPSMQEVAEPDNVIDLSDDNAVTDIDINSGDTASDTNTTSNDFDDFLAESELSSGEDDSEPENTDNEKDV